jgi:hypothetical protein
MNSQYGFGCRAPLILDSRLRPWVLDSQTYMQGAEACLPCARASGLEISLSELYSCDIFRQACFRELQNTEVTCQKNSIVMNRQGQSLSTHVPCASQSQPAGHPDSLREITDK